MAAAETASVVADDGDGGGGGIDLEIEEVVLEVVVSSLPTSLQPSYPLTSSDGVVFELSTITALALVAAAAAATVLLLVVVVVVEAAV